MTDSQSPAMTSNRPYLIRAMHEWISDNGLTPYLLVDAGYAGVQVPPQAVNDGRVVLNVATRAVSRLELGNQSIRFLARFSGASQAVELPVAAVQAIYAQETGQGMMLPQEGDSAAAEPGGAARGRDAVTAAAPAAADRLCDDAAGAAGTQPASGQVAARRMPDMVSGGYIGFRRADPQQLLAEQGQSAGLAFETLS